MIADLVGSSLGCPQARSPLDDDCFTVRRRRVRPLERIMVRPRLLVVICAIAVSAVVSGVIAAASEATGARLEHKPVHHSAPTDSASLRTIPLGLSHWTTSVA